MTAIRTYLYWPIWYEYYLPGVWPKRKFEQMTNYKADFLADFAFRTRKNMALVAAKADQESSQQTKNEAKRAFEVTQLINSSLGLFVFISSKMSDKDLKIFDVDSPQEILEFIDSLNASVENAKNIEKIRTFSDLIYCLRNAIAHGDFTPSADSSNDIEAFKFRLGGRKWRRSKKREYRITVKELELILNIIFNCLGVGGAPQGDFEETLDQSKDRHGEPNPDTNGNYEPALLSLAVECWRLSRLSLRLLRKLEEREAGRYESQFRYFLKAVEDNLNAAGLKMVNLEGQPFEPGLPVSAINGEDFGPDDRLLVEQMIEPIITGAEGFKKTGLVVLKKEAEGDGP